MAYQPKNIEPKWQKFWDEKQVFKTGQDRTKPKYYVLDMFPYPSSQGLHVGHPEGYTATDILARYKRTKGFNVLHPMGWDAFGLPAEQYALKTGVHPEITTKQAIENFKRQLKSLGFSYDWDHEISTCDPKYYKWTQYIFQKLYERGLAYQKEVPVNWCPELKTVLANEEVVDGKSERGGHPVFRVPMKQWMLKITEYADRLLKDLDALDWPESTKELQRNWIGRSEGLKAEFPILDHASEKIEIFTTRPDTIFGVTFMVLAPEHPLVQKIIIDSKRNEVDSYIEEASRKSEIARQDQSKEKTGVFTGAYAINPFNHSKIPVWISDYVMMGYGTGAIMAVPGHDERDQEFAKKFNLPIIEVISEDGIAHHSDFIDGMYYEKAKEAVIARAEELKFGKRTVQYKLRDWLFSRQRYWGEPFPILRDESGKIVPVDLNELPVTLPEVKSYEPTGTGESPLAAIHSWVNHKGMKRETDTMPGSAGSSWYFLRYIDPKNDKEPWSKDAEKYWMPVDLYLGGAEHAVGHLLYARFWMKVLHDAGLVLNTEPFRKLIHQGMILGEDGEKMSKSRGNVINPDSVVDQYGADTLRIYEMFMGPLEKEKPWSTQAIEGVYRFLNRVWRVYVSEADQCLLNTAEPTIDDLRLTHQTIKKVTEDIEGLRFNTAISQMMIWVNHFTKNENSRSLVCLKPFIQILNPFAPHLAEELWEKIGCKEILSLADWPSFDPELAKNSSITVAVQVLGKTRGTIEIEEGQTQADVEKLAKEASFVQSQLAGKTIKKVIYVPNKIINFVVI